LEKGNIIHLMKVLLVTAERGLETLGFAGCINFYSGVWLSETKQNSAQVPCSTNQRLCAANPRREGAAKL
jgi:hypothetical protein